MRRILFFLALGLLFIPVTLSAQTYDAGDCNPGPLNCHGTPHAEGPTKMDPKLDLLRRVMETEGLDSSVFGPAGAPRDVDEERVSVLVRFDAALNKDERSLYEERGVDFEVRDGRVVRVGDIYLARVKWSALEELARDRRIRRVESTWSPTVELPLETTSKLVGAAQAQRHPELEVDGSGVTVVDIDDGFDVFHPHMFRADGGLYEWHDEDNTGRFDPGVDTVEIDGQRYTLRVLHATQYDRDYSSEPVGDFQPDRDWLYADINDNQQRDVGPQGGFTESDPAYGEPLFVVDDVNRNGQLDAGEKLVRLDTSKFKKVVHDGQSYLRGDNLIEVMDAQYSTYHGAGVTSILAGGQPGFHNRVGLAPGVEIIGHSYFVEEQSQGGSFSDQFYAIQDAMESDAQIVLHEWTDIVSMPFDGSSLVEQAMDTARDAGVIQVNPVGNLNSAGKHIHREVAAGESVELEFYVGNGFQWGQQTVPYAVIYLSLFWRGDHTPEVTLIGPSGLEEVLDTSSSQFNDAQLWVNTQETERNTRQMLVYLWKENQLQSLDVGDYTLRLEGFEHDDGVTGRITDQHSSWGRGVTWHDETIDYGTAVYPSSADSAIGVAAFGGVHPDFSTEPGELRDYSGRGPRLDGAPMVDLAAPDDPYAAMTTSGEFGPHFSDPAPFMTFGGTSGAGPHVAAAAALLMDHFPEWDADAIEDQLLASAMTDELTPDFGDLPNHHWGLGKVDVFTALFGEPGTEDPPQLPQADLVVIAEDGEEVVFDASASSASDGEELEYRFDIEYDGIWDQDWSSDPHFSLPPSDFEPGSEYTARVDVRTPSGARSGALATFIAPELESPQPDPEEEDEDDEEGAEDDAEAESPPLQVVEQDGGCNAIGGSSNPATILLVVALIALSLIRRTKDHRRLSGHNRANLRI